MNGDSEREAERPVGIAGIFVQHRRAFEKIAGSALCGGVVGAFEPQRELVAAEAGHQVAGPGFSNQQSGDGLERFVALLMAEDVVDRLEIIEIDIEQRARRGIANATLQAQAKLGVEGAAVQQPRSTRRCATAVPGVCGC